MAGQISQTIVAAEIIVILNQQTIGIANEFSAQVDYGIRAIGEIDNLIPRELIPGSVKTTFKISGFMSRTADIEACGIFTPPGANIVSNYVSLQIFDRKDNRQLLSIPSAMIADVAFSTRSSTFMLFDFSGIGIGMTMNDTNGLTIQYVTLTPPAS